MQDIYGQFSGALAELKKVAPASKYDAVFNEQLKLKTIEAKMNLVTESLKPFKESAAGRNNRRLETLVERAPIRMYNGREHNYNESDPLQRNDRMTTTATRFTEADGTVDEKLEGRVRMLQEKAHFTEQEARIFLSCETREGAHGPEVFNRPAVPKNFTHRQKRDFGFFRACGISESEALAMAKVLPNEIKPASVLIDRSGEDGF